MKHSELRKRIIVVNLPHLNYFFIKLVFYKKEVLYCLSRIKSLPVSLRIRSATNEKLNIPPKASYRWKKRNNIPPQNPTPRLSSSPKYFIIISTLPKDIHCTKSYHKISSKVSSKTLITPKL